MDSSSSNKNKLLVMTWNIQGIDSNNFLYTLKELIRCFNPKVIALGETRISGQQATKVCSKIWFSSQFRVDAQNYRGSTFSNPLINTLEWKNSGKICIDSQALNSHDPEVILLKLQNLLDLIEPHITNNRDTNLIKQELGISLKISLTIALSLTYPTDSLQYQIFFDLLYLKHIGFRMSYLSNA
ncbi:hypothetical protein Cgig2_008698 [Carnegiea gigantea]|uniref:Endonuclease/exonuclease/phosphatase domain-containing protein n=1 Tax=Carnegiea gigantea TaxID=171969 RepID=A0A9Q1GPU0_9CARY|nr:hypothetical protein Cgig2_008698 [Carnegiea gigantea]